ncbi:MAG: bifunctional pyr operon transcriptional regulator/uracil phosphoribosyltransferase PyrR [Desulfobulbaceae bacterium]|jgi:pyrimidine operon attenuation protein/uracil phosphoribosyltransferase|nr:bifunctional pyr operon transcriptional regulator/uracil phosphoribosyltransferase PyrR [Desulfobulbaceae bacterium]
MNQRILMREHDIDLALQRIALQILENNSAAGRLALVGIHTCGVFLAQRLRTIIGEHFSHRVDYGTLDINLYRDDWSLVSQNPVVRTTDIAFEVDGAHLLLVDDVIFTGRTIRAAMDAIMDYGRPKTVQLAVLADRGGRELPIQPDYTGLRAAILPDERITVRLGGGEENVVVIESE